MDTDPKTTHHIDGALKSPEFTRLIEERPQQELRKVICLCVIPVVLDAYSGDDSYFDQRYDGSR